MFRLNGVEFDLIQSIKDLMHEIKLLRQNQIEIEKRLNKIEFSKTSENK